MADRTSAHLFGEFLHAVLEPESDSVTPRERAIELLHMTRGYDFSPYQMGADDLLIRHDLLRVRWDPDWGEWQDVYAHQEGFEDGQPPKED